MNDLPMLGTWISERMLARETGWDWWKSQAREETSLGEQVGSLCSWHCPDTGSTEAKYFKRMLHASEAARDCWNSSAGTRV